MQLNDKENEIDQRSRQKTTTSRRENETNKIMAGSLLFFFFAAISCLLPPVIFLSIGLNNKTQKNAKLIQKRQCCQFPIHYFADALSLPKIKHLAQRIMISLTSMPLMGTSHPQQYLYKSCFKINKLSVCTSRRQGTSANEKRKLYNANLSRYKRKLYNANLIPK